MQSISNALCEDVNTLSREFSNKNLKGLSETGNGQCGECEQAGASTYTAWNRDAGSTRLAWALSDLSQR